MKFFYLLILSVLVAAPVQAQTPANVTLTWTAPGDDGNVGTATRYEMRWSTAKPDSLQFGVWWSAAAVVPNMPVPTIAGTTQSVVFTPTGGFTFDTSYYFIIRAVDNVGNIAPYSNVVTYSPLPDTLPPGKVQDLR